jgi:hypothetical protein
VATGGGDKSGDNFICSGFVLQAIPSDGAVHRQEVQLIP